MEVENSIYLKIQLQKNPPVFLKDMADIVFGSLKLANRSLIDATESKCTVEKINKFSPRKKIESDKKRLLDGNGNFSIIRTKGSFA